MNPHLRDFTIAATIAVSASLLFSFDVLASRFADHIDRDECEMLLPAVSDTFAPSINHCVAETWEERRENLMQVVADLPESF